jgi:hypothetical protein
MSVIWGFIFGNGRSGSMRIRHCKCFNFYVVKHYEPGSILKVRRRSLVNNSYYIVHRHLKFCFTRYPRRTKSILRLPCPKLSQHFSLLFTPRNALIRQNFVFPCSPIRAVICANLAVPDKHPFIYRQTLKPNRAARMYFVRADTDFGAEAISLPISHARRCVPVDAA